MFCISLFEYFQHFGVRLSSLLILVHGSFIPCVYLVIWNFELMVLETLSVGLWGLGLKWISSEKICVYFCQRPESLNYILSQRFQSLQVVLIQVWNLHESRLVGILRGNASFFPFHSELMHRFVISLFWGVGEKRGVGGEGREGGKEGENEFILLIH